MRRTATILATVAAIACSGKGSDAKPPSAADALADAAAAKTMPTEKYVSPTSQFDLTLPGVWTGKYRVTEKKDTTAGAHLAAEFIFIPDSGSKAPPRTLMTLRLFSRAAWEATAKRGRPIGTKLGERGDEVFALSLPESNPYPPGSPEAPAYDLLIISIAQGGQQVHLTFR